MDILPKSNELDWRKKKARHYWDVFIGSRHDIFDSRSERISGSNQSSSGTLRVLPFSWLIWRYHACSSPCTKQTLRDRFAATPCPGRLPSYNRGEIRLFPHDKDDLQGLNTRARRSEGHEPATVWRSWPVEREARVWPGVTLRAWVGGIVFC